LQLQSVAQTRRRLNNSRCPSRGSGNCGIKPHDRVGTLRFAHLTFSLHRNHLDLAQSRDRKHRVLEAASVVV
jgi:hypothetical protein